MNNSVAEQRVWTDADFETVSWRENRVHGQAFLLESNGFALDIDYIARWVPPAGSEGFFSFWLAPATLYFENVTEIEVTIGIHRVYELSITELRQISLGNMPHGACESRRYEIDLSNGSISLQAAGFTLYLRKSPSLSTSQFLTLEERGGISFARERQAT